MVNKKAGPNGPAIYSDNKEYCNVQTNGAVPETCTNQVEGAAVKVLPVMHELKAKISIQKLLLNGDVYKLQIVRFCQIAPGINPMRIPWGRFPAGRLY